MSDQSGKVRRELEQYLAGTQSELANRLVTKLRERTPVRTGRTASLWTKVENGAVTDVTNAEGDTIMRLNDGHSRKAPSGFIEATIDETVAEMQREVKKP